MNRAALVTRRSTSPDGTELVSLIALQDNYVYLIWEPESKGWIVIDPSKAEAVEDFLAAEPLPRQKLVAILNTHHHLDHVGGNTALVAKWRCPVYCSLIDKDRVPQATHALTDEQDFQIGARKFKAYLIPGHTRGQMAYELLENITPREPHEASRVDHVRKVFVGDTVFAMGCGRLLEGTPVQMAQTLSRLAAFGPQTELYVGHEYAQKNASFAQMVDSQNSKIRLRLDKINENLVQYGIATPTLLCDELQTNPFFRTDAPEIHAYLGLEGVNKNHLEAFTRLRSLRDRF